jgi:hypothetical protein
MRLELSRPPYQAVLAVGRSPVSFDELRVRIASEEHLIVRQPAQHPPEPQLGTEVEEDMGMGVASRPFQLWFVSDPCASSRATWKAWKEDGLPVESGAASH